VELRAFARGEQALQRAWPMQADWHWQFRILQWREEERLIADCTLRHRATRSSRQRVIVKWYGDTTGSVTFALMQALEGQLEAQDDRLLAAPRPLFYDPAARMLVQEAVPGIPYQDLLRRPRYRHYLRQAGRALARLHRLPGAAAGTGKRLEDHMKELMRPAPLALTKAVPEVRAQVEALVAAMLHIEAASHRSWAPAWLHRDFHIGQLFYGRGRVWVIDWDLAACGDPALDIGNFLYNLDNHLAGQAAAARAAFVEGYLERGEPLVVRRSPLYEAFTCLRRACKALREQRPGWRSGMSKSIAAGEECLARL
jgi:aminoglycoside phosphotransferase (APT) family kinase protein